MSLHEVISNQPVVIDQGSGMIKAGFAGDLEPKHIAPTCVGRPKHRRVMTDAVEGAYFMGGRIAQHRGLLRLSHPIEHGVVTNWEDAERLWQHTYSKEGLGVAPEEHPVLLTEQPLNSTRNREKAASVFFENFNVPALYFALPAVLSLYASGRTTGVVLDSGDGVTTAVPVYEGFAMPLSINRMDLAGRDVTRQLRMLLRKEGYDLHTSAEFDIARTIKERVCYFELDPSRAGVESSSEPSTYTLPDESIIEVGQARHRAAEILFNPQLADKEYMGVHEMVYDSVFKCDIDMRVTLLSNIVLSGGSTLMRGFGNRLVNELHRVVNNPGRSSSTQQTAQRSNIRTIRVSAPRERLYSAWIGGSILASLDAFKTMWVSKQEYDDVGPNVLHRKTF
ncbi:beta-centracetin [Capsaspora owczarzaki ATCC 30864]|uniref:Beta-centracetin n=1 Tax=Capsaspora owczarzaki (strain ATCC 30864) TaxID=595528 RepID=A0A0D2UAB5_CAPO3|nr:beta-centracetin [Capsaspora owczarzaki ATCC 30864]KJE91991.1 beta-centracetin [Capsaspora owczarzaki ATCC 30864]|eukprot:XP_004363872.1 beta-centracetin [Capsaspora owczarzaki ATCC 30864]